MTPAEFLVPISLAITLLWPWWTFRFVVPLAPFLFLYLIKGLSMRDDFRIARIVLLSIVGLNFTITPATSISPAETPRRWIGSADSTRPTPSCSGLTGTWTNMRPSRRQTPRSCICHTGQPTITLDTLTEKWSVWRIVVRATSRRWCATHYRAPGEVGTSFVTILILTRTRGSGSSRSSDNF